MDSEQNTKLTVSKDLKAKLDSLRHTGQSYGGFIDELIEDSTKSATIIELLKTENTTLKNEITKYKEANQHG
jgi:hypothetical protein